MGRRVVAEWSEATMPAEVIAGWASLTRMGSVAVDPALHQQILPELEARLVRSCALDHPEVGRKRYAARPGSLPQ